MTDTAQGTAVATDGRRRNDQQDRASFYLTGHRMDTHLGNVEGLGLRSAHFAPYRRLTELRYDFPLVLADGPDVHATMWSLSGLVDDLLAKVATGEDAGRVRHHAIELEREIRVRADAGPARLSAAWDDAARALLDASAGGQGPGGEPDPELADSLARLTAARTVDGRLVTCGHDTPREVVGHLWGLVQRERERHLTARVAHLRDDLQDILDAEQASSPAGLAGDRLAASLGPVVGAELDTEALSRMLTDNRPRFTLSDSRRARVRRLLDVLTTQRFVPSGEEGDRHRPRAVRLRLHRRAGGAGRPPRTVRRHDRARQGPGDGRDGGRRPVPRGDPRRAVRQVERRRPGHRHPRAVPRVPGPRRRRGDDLRGQRRAARGAVRGPADQGAGAGQRPAPGCDPAGPPGRGRAVRADAGQRRAGLRGVVRHAVRELGAVPRPRADRRRVERAGRRAVRGVLRRGRVARRPAALPRGGGGHRVAGVPLLRLRPGRRGHPGRNASRWAATRSRSSTGRCAGSPTRTTPCSGSRSTCRSRRRTSGRATRGWSRTSRSRPTTARTARWCRSPSTWRRTRAPGPASCPTC